MAEIQFTHAAFSINNKGQMRQLSGPLLMVAIFSNETRPPAEPALQSTVIYNETVNRFQICTGDRWRSVTMP